MAWSLFSSGVSPKSWAVSVLQAGGWPQTAANIQSLISWAILEGGGGTYNPLNTTQGSGSNFNSVGVKNFSSWSAGVSATVATINNGHYPTIVSDLKTGSGIGSTPNLSTWSGGGYSSLSGGWTRAASYLSGQTAALPGGGSAAPGTGPDPSVISDVWSWVQDAASGIFGVAAAPFDIGKSIASLAVPFVTLAEKIDWLFHPSHWIRIIAFFGGAGFMGFGIWNMSHVGQQAPIIGNQSFQGIRIPAPSANLPVGIFSVGIGGVLLFVAFHNVPDSVQNFTQFIAWMFSNFTAPGSSPAGGSPTTPGAGLGAGALAGAAAGGIGDTGGLGGAAITGAAAGAAPFVPATPTSSASLPEGVTAGQHGR